MTVDEALTKLRECDHYLEELHVVKAEIERLRAENDRLVNANLVIAEESVRLHAENARLRETYSAAHEAHLKIHAELGWFRRREWIVIAVIEAAEPYSTALHNAVSTFKKWMGANPKPGAGV